MATKKPQLELARVEKLQQELSGLQEKMSKLGGKEAKQSGQILAEVAKLAREIAGAGDTAMKDHEAKKAELQDQAKKVQDLIKRLGSTRG